MKQTKIFFTLCFFLSQSLWSTAGDVPAEKIYSKVSRSVVIIYTYSGNVRQSGQGSGVMISKDGKIVTNFHVIENAERIEIGINGKRIEAKIIGIDPGHDLAILKMPCRSCEPINRESHTVNVGEKIYAIGSPMGYENTISEGMVSGRRKFQGTNSDLLQITAPLSPGSSGGAIVNSRGVLIGISAIAFQGNAQNINFAIPAERIDSIILKDEIPHIEITIASNLRQVEMMDMRTESHKIIMLVMDVLEYDPSNELAIGLLASNYFVNHNYEEALKWSKNLKALNSKNFTACFVSGNSYFSTGKFIPALEDAHQMVLIDAKIGSGHCLLGRCYYLLNKYDSAALSLQKAIDIDSNDHDAWHYLACINCEKKNFRLAESYALKAIDKNPKYFESYLLAGKLYSVFKDEDLAREYYSEASKLNYRSSLAHLLSAQSYLNSELYPLAKREAYKSLLYDKDECAAYEIILLADLLNSGDQETADDFQKLKECDPKNSFEYSSYFSNDGMKASNVSTEKIQERVASMFSFEDSLIVKINNEELKMKNMSEKQRTGYKYQADALNKRNSVIKRTYGPVDTLHIAGNYYMECKELLSFKGKMVMNLLEWLPGSEADIDAFIYDSKGNKLARIASGKLISFGGDEIKVRSTPGEFICYTKSPDNYIIKMVRANTKDKGMIQVSLKMYLPDGTLLQCTPDTGNDRLNIIGGRNSQRGGSCIQIF